ncbi:hypothetical protein [Odoribacter sp. Z80]|uniref:hypothetical protein n=1 Tax=Odoribacter sp. Z80 TaxID=2304575 RepID=UPI00137AB969|nr:hypothetical protein [Odoribacter sp. Z80]NCE73251.1 hypothetical protein [Odoribacter sp. Z80]
MEKERPIPRIYPEVSIGNWVITLIILAIPLVNIIMLFVWAFNRNTNITKANWAKATLILLAVWIVLGLLFGSHIMHWFYQGYPMGY